MGSNLPLSSRAAMPSATAAVIGRGVDRYPSGPASNAQQRSRSARPNELDPVNPPQDDTSDAQASLASRSGIVGLVRAVPIRWRILSIAALNSLVVLVLASMIWSGARVLSSAWDDVRQVRESDKILALLESETGRLQNLIHRYINQPSPDLFAEILLLREAVLGTLTTRASTDPMLSGSVAELERVTERFLNGFGDLRALQATIKNTYENQVQGPARDIAGLYSIIEGATGRRDAPDLAAARPLARGLHGDAGRGQLLLSVAVQGSRRGRAPQHRDDRAHRAGDDRPRRQRPAADGAAAAEGAHRRAARRPADPVRAARQPQRSAAQRHRRQPGRDHRGDRRAVGEDAAARAEGAGNLRPHARPASRARCCRSR